jgi:biopolymer transport protein ExbB/TolQ
MDSASNGVVFALVERRMERAAATTRTEMGRGLSVLAAISATAPFLGFLGTCIGIYSSFRGVAGEKWTDLAAVLELLSEALMPTVLGLAVAIPTWWAHQYFSGCLDTFEVEMKTASAELLNRLP